MEAEIHNPNITLTTTQVEELTSFHPASIMASPDMLRTNAEMYFMLTPVPTPAGLCLHLGFASARLMMNAIESEDHPEESRYVLACAVTKLEDALTTSALKDDVNVTMAKFVLSARLGMAEKSEKHTMNDSVMNIQVHGLEEDTAAATERTAISDILEGLL